MPSKVILIAARAKMSLSRAQNIFMPANINSIVILPYLLEEAPPSNKRRTCSAKNLISRAALIRVITVTEKMTKSAAAKVFVCS